MAAVATLSQRMEYLIDQAKSKRIVNHDLLNQIFIEVGQLEAPLEARLVEEFQNSLDINEILARIDFGPLFDSKNEYINN